MRNTAKLFASALLLLAPTLAASCSNGTPTPTPIAKPISTSASAHPCKNVDLTAEFKLHLYEGTEKDFEGLYFLYPEKWDASSTPARELKNSSVITKNSVWASELSLSREGCGEEEKATAIVTSYDGSTSTAENSFTMYVLEAPIQISRYYIDEQRTENNEWLRSLDDWSNTWKKISASGSTTRKIEQERDIQLKGTSARLVVLRLSVPTPSSLVFVAFERHDSIYELRLQSEDSVLAHNLIIFQTLLDSLEFK